MSRQKVKLRQVVDWSASIWAGIIAGAIFMILNLILIPIFVGGNHWMVLRQIASIPMGADILPPPATFSGSAMTAALITHFAISIASSMLIAFVIHRWGLLVGIFGGAALGLALYLINIYSLTFFFPWLFTLNSWTFMINHVLFGAIAGGVYEAFEVEEFVPVE